MDVTIKDLDNRWIYVKNEFDKVIFAVKLTEEGWKEYCKNITSLTSASFDWSWAEIVMDYEAIMKAEF